MLGAILLMIEILHELTHKRYSEQCCKLLRSSCQLHRTCHNNVCPALCRAHSLPTSMVSLVLQYVFIYIYVHIEKYVHRYMIFIYTHTFIIWGLAGSTSFLRKKPLWHVGNPGQSESPASSCSLRLLDAVGTALDTRPWDGHDL